MNQAPKKQETITYSAIANLPALAAALALAYAVFVPFAYHLALLACRAIFPWFIWYDAYFVIAEVALEGGFVAAAVFPTMVSFCAVRWLIGRFMPQARRARPVRHRVWRGLRMALWISIGIPAALLFAALFVWDAAAFGNPLPTADARLQAERCSGCHSANRPFHYLKTPEQWAVTVERMRAVNGAPVSQEEAARLAAFLGRRASYSDAWLFRAKCLRCHAQKELAARNFTTEEWSLVIDRLANVNQFAFRADWRAQLAKYADEHLAVQPPVDPEQRRRWNENVLFQQRCGACHSLAFGLQPTDAKEAPPALVERMRKKAPAIITADETLALTAALEHYLTQSPPQRSAFPHDQAVEVNW
ncbi:MAG: hypothetical protein P9L99_10950 [Candidatus Lernaella stagnicola]|nr:hypothetical protein [Candidatus Lernaella stagnicola]